ncbi:hypothetical protein ST47_g6364 [Ascochyta rabiei]|uniref:Uncharacterized protein n=1 Tax=Didymella rabiei TaxID=5454 RepID=A0A163CGQ9_DIDRA|nr:hypothetical protein ST47_g6364 [Ascochyta rabiei]
MGHIYSRLVLNHDLSFADLDNMIDAREMDIDELSASLDLVCYVRQVHRELLLSTSSATVFLGFVLEGGGGYLDPGVAEVIEATREALADVGVSWEELLEALRQGQWNVGVEKCEE